MDLTISEAAQHLKVSERTVRRRLHSGNLPGRQMSTPQGFTWLIELANEPPEQLSNNGDFTALRELVEVLKAQLENKDKQIQELHVLLQQSKTALNAPTTNHQWWQFWKGTKVTTNV